MNKGELAKMKDRRVRLRPVAKQLAQEGPDLGELDCTWCAGQASEKGLLLIRKDGPQWFFLPSDLVLKYQTDAERPTDGILLVDSQVYIRGSDVHVEPIHPLPKVPTRTPTTVQNGTLSPGSTLRPEEITLLQRMADLGNLCCTADQIAEGLLWEKTPATKVIYFLDRLVRGEYLFQGPQPMGSPPTYGMDHRGREFLVENDLLG